MIVLFIYLLLLQSINRLLLPILSFHIPLDILTEATGIAVEGLAGFLVTFQLPLQFYQILLFGLIDLNW